MPLAVNFYQFADKVRFESEGETSDLIHWKFLRFIHIFCIFPACYILLADTEMCCCISVLRQRLRTSMSEPCENKTNRKKYIF